MVRVQVVLLLVGPLVLLWWFRPRPQPVLRYGLQNGTAPPSVAHSDGFCTVQNVLSGELAEYERITLVLHESYDKFDDAILDQLSNWDGPVSLAISFPPNATTNSHSAQCILSKLHEYQRRVPAVRLRLSVHFTFFGFSSCKLDDLNGTNMAENCNIDKVEYEYPINVVRNAARKPIRTRFMVIADMDHFFSRNFEPNVLGLAKQVLGRDPKSVLVYRIFEVERNVTEGPRTKADLRRLYQAGLAQEFHKKTFDAHSIPGLGSWLWWPESVHRTSIQMYRPYVNDKWEPQFVSERNIPYHDSTFVYPIKDNTVLRWEMCRAGFRFLVMHDAFMYHLGTKQPEDLRERLELRERMTAKAKLALAGFDQRMDRVYPNSKSACPEFTIPLFVNASGTSTMSTDAKDEQIPHIDDEKIV